jgi:hypothetical protein
MDAPAYGCDDAIILDDLGMAYPKTTAKRLRELELIRKKLRM